MNCVYFGFFCSEEFIAIWRAPGTFSTGLPPIELDGPVVVRDCPGCKENHIFQPSERAVKKFSELQLLHSYEKQAEE
jgi:hypothetical protein